MPKARESQRVAIVTGGASGIGRACALALAEEGARVAVLDRDEKSSKAVKKELGRKGLIFSGDVAVPGEIDRVVNELLERFGRLDVAVNAAGVGGAKARTGEQPLEELDRVMGVNLDAVFRSMRAEIRAILAGGRGGAIVNVSSIFGLRPEVNAPLYSAAKAAIIGLTRSAALEYAPLGLRINAICPGPIRTPLFERSYGASLIDRALPELPSKRLGEPEEIGATVAWLCSDRASFVVGQALVVDGGALAG
jgi:NAD(P)-dependent dehydrogenase (short-subunit alcohol dehydrogenase family)